MKIQKYLFNPVLMESWVEFPSPQNISESKTVLELSPEQLKQIGTCFKIKTKSC